MIDIHSHILANVDDGAVSDEESLEMAREAVRQGISAVVATPHHQNGHYYNDKQTIIEKVDILNDRLQDAQIPLSVLPGQEVRMYGEIIDDLELGEILTINHSQYLLLEFPFDVIPFYADQLIFDLQAAGITPIIAHPERNREMLEYPEKLYQYVANGVLTQLTAGSLLGHFGKEIQRFSEQLIRAQFIHVMASDAHHVTNRPFQLREAYTIVKTDFGQEVVQMFQENSYLITENMHINRLEPLQAKARRRLFGLF